MLFAKTEPRLLDAVLPLSSLTQEFQEFQVSRRAGERARDIKFELDLQLAVAHPSRLLRTQPKAQFLEFLFRHRERVFNAEYSCFRDAGERRASHMLTRAGSFTAT